MTTFIVIAMVMLVGLGINNILVIDIAILAACVAVAYYAIKFAVEDSKQDRR